MAPRLSFAYFFKLICTFLAIFLPYILSLSRRDYPIGVWLKRDAYREQPEVHFQYKAIVVAQTKDSSGMPKELYYSTMREVNDARPESFRAASVVVREVDENLDGLIDQLYLHFKIPLEGEQVYGVRALIFLDYRLQDHVKVDLDSLSFIRYNGGLPSSSYETRGDLVLRQNLPMSIREDFVNPYSDSELINVLKATFSASESNIGKIIERYGARHITTNYVERFPLWNSNTHTSSGRNNEAFDLKITIDIPRLQQVIFIPTFPMVLLEAWMRYLSLLVIAVHLMRRLLLFVHSNRLLTSQKVIDKSS